jgi:hypothetical protein
MDRLFMILSQEAPLMRKRLFTALSVLGLAGAAGVSAHPATPNAASKAAQENAAGTTQAQDKTKDKQAELKLDKNQQQIKSGNAQAEDKSKNAQAEQKLDKSQGTVKIKNNQAEDKSKNADFDYKKANATSESNGTKANTTTAMRKAGGDPQATDKTDQAK